MFGNPAVRPLRIASCQLQLPVAISNSISGPSAPQLLTWAERISSTILLLLLLPLLALAALAIAVISGRGPLIAHARVGYLGRHIWVLKLRTMWPCGARPSRGSYRIERIDGETVPEDKGIPDQRVTSRLAAFFRKHSIDELPQLWHVVRGEMSLVGPRPMTPQEIRRWYGEHAREVLRVKPGLTGLWQVSGRSSLGYDERRKLDLYLARNWSLRLYFSILFATIPGILTGKDAN